MKKFITCLSILGLLTISGCFESEEEVTLNPDGSGKMKIEAILQIGALSVAMGQESDPQHELTRSVRQILENSEGVTAWSDVSWQLRPDGKADFAATAYFDDINQLNIENIGIIGIRAQQTPDGKLKITLGEPKNQDKQARADGSATEPIEGINLDAKVAQAKQQYQQSSAMMRPILASMSESITLRPPGKVLQASKELTRNPDGSAQFQIDGNAIMARMDALMQDDQRIVAMIRSGRDPLDAPLDKPLTLLVQLSEQPQFDYQREVVAAQKSFKPVQQKLGIIPTVTQPQNLSGGSAVSLQNVRIGGVRLIYEADMESGIRPFNYDKGYSVAVLADITGSVIGIQNGRLETALSSRDENLLPEQDWSRTIHFPTLSEDKRQVMFELNMSLPAEPTAHLKTVGGYLECLIANGTDEVDLGFKSLQAGQLGSRFDATIKSIKKEKNFMDETQFVLEMEVKLAHDTIRSWKFVDANGKTIAIDHQGSSWYDNTTHMNFAAKGPYPTDARIVLEVYQDAQKLRLPFELENYTLTGLPGRNVDLADDAGRIEQQ